MSNVPDPLEARLRAWGELERDAFRDDGQPVAPEATFSSSPDQPPKRPRRGRITVLVAAVLAGGVVVGIAALERDYRDHAAVGPSSAPPDRTKSAGTPIGCGAQAPALADGTRLDATLSVANGRTTIRVKNLTNRAVGILYLQASVVAVNEYGSIISNDGDKPLPAGGARLVAPKATTEIHESPRFNACNGSKSPKRLLPQGEYSIVGVFDAFVEGNQIHVSTAPVAVTIDALGRIIAVKEVPD